MTREEAIQVLNMVEAHGSLVIQAKDMAIKALGAEPSEDAISRQAAIKAHYEERENPKEILKDLSFELEKMIKEHEGSGDYEMGIQVGLSMARVLISNRLLDLEGIPK